MKHRRWNIFFHELVGLQVKLLSYPDPSLKGAEGIIVEETEKTITILVGGRKVKLLKQNSLLLVTLPNGDRVVLKGEDIIGDPAERVKRLERGRGVARLVSSAKHRYPWAQAARENM